MSFDPTFSGGLGGLGGRSQGEERGMQNQSVLAKVAMVVICLTLPVTSPFCLVALLFYQFCLVERLSAGTKAATLIAAVFLSVAWIPYVNVMIFFLDPTVNRHCSQNVVNGILPVGLFYVFCIWALWVAFRHFSIADSYEDLADRQHLRHLKAVELSPPLSKESGDATKLVNTAYDLYFELKGREPPLISLFVVLTLLVTTGVVTPSRIFARGAGEVGFSRDAFFVISQRAIQVVINGTTISSEECSISVKIDNASDPRNGTTLYFENQHFNLWVLSTVQYCGIFLVFFASIATVTVGFLHEIRLLRNLKLCLPDFEADQARRLNLQNLYGEPEHRFHCRLDPSNITHLRAWDAVRRTGANELTSGNTVFQSVFTPSMVIIVIGTLGSYVYIIQRILFGGQQLGFFSLPVMVFGGISLVILLAVFFLARLAQGYMKSHRTLIAKISFDISRELDKQMRLKLVGDPTPVNSHVNDDLLASLVAMRTYMVGNLPRIRMVGVELQHIRWAVAVLLLLNALVIFFALMTGIRERKCSR